jgi:hypothetical protein
MSQLRSRPIPSITPPPPSTPTRLSPYDPRLSARFDNTALTASLAAILVSLALVTANFVVLVAPAKPQHTLCAQAVYAYNAVLLVTSLIMFAAGFAALFVLVFAVPESSLGKYKASAVLAMGIAAAIEFIVGGIYGMKLWASIENNRDCAAYSVLVVSLIASWAVVGIPAAALFYSKFWKEEAKKVKSTERTQVKKYVL